MLPLIFMQPGHHLEARGIGHEDGVRFRNTGETLNRGSIETDTFFKGSL